LNEILIVVGTKENIASDISILGTKWSPNAQVIVPTGKEMKTLIVEKASALFLDENLVLVLVDPDKNVITELKDQLDILRDRIHIIIYSTTTPPDYLKNISKQILFMDKDKETRIKKRVLAFLRQYNKKMTDKAFKALVERIKDESNLESELIKVINYIGDKSNIDSKDIHIIVTQLHEDSLITLFDAMAKLDREEMLKIFENLLRNGVHILAIHSYLVRQIRLLLQAKDMEELYRANPDYTTFVKILGKWKQDLEIKTSEKKHYFPCQKPFYAHKLSKASRKIPKQTLISFFNSLTIADVRTKRGTRFDQIYMERDLLGA
jgi:DNA polymerase III delta subunit